MHKTLKQLAVAVAACAATLLAGRSALVSTSGTLGGNYQAPQYAPTKAALQQVLTPTIFEANVFLYDAPDIPLHLRLPASTNSTDAIVSAVVDKLVNTNLWLPLTGGGMTGQITMRPENILADPIVILGNGLVRLFRIAGFGVSGGDLKINVDGMTYTKSQIGSDDETYTYAYPTNSGTLALKEDIPQNPFTEAVFTNGAWIVDSSVGGAQEIALMGLYQFEDILTAHEIVLEGSTNSLLVIDNELTYGGEPIGGSGGGGLSTARVSATDTSVVSGDYLVWLDTRGFAASQSVTLTLPDMDGDAQTIVVRRLGNDGTATIARGTNTWTLAYDGDGVTVDWLGAATNWFWRTF